MAPLAKLLAEFNPNNPVISSYNQSSNAQALLHEDARSELDEWRGGLNLDPTMPELAILIRHAEPVLMVHPSFSSIELPGREMRVRGVGYVLLQLLEIQDHLGEPLNLNGEMLKDLIDGSVCPVPAEDIRPPTFERMRPSNNEPSLAQPVEEPLRSKRARKNAGTESQKARKRAKISLDTEQSGAELRNHNTSGRGKGEGQTGRRDFSTRKYPVEVTYDLYLTTRGYSMWTMLTYKPTT
ncbi:hypothetical protein GGX14DRAFT_401657 [Mycena pura]|uniref:Uncharacterized protein n=1 Tax=Mycena pura TaxID=153505 RepID=A0AAD6V3Q2_9AGAR|nr:hypothetical protein GGX14DRAFT_401657 [Mycena pura]